jgi:metallophosphoesterase superfamily enzyme
MSRKKQLIESAWDEYRESDSILAIGDLHENETRLKAIKEGVDSLFLKIKDKTFSKIVLLGDLFDKKPTTKERFLLAQFLKRLRNHSKQIHFIIGNGKHTFEGEYIYEQDWIELCSDFFQHEELNLGKYVFTHSEFSGLRYANGKLSDSSRAIDKNKVYVSGHIHQPHCSFGNVNYVGSLYKTTFSEIDDKKRVCIIKDNKIEWIEIASRHMYEILLIGKESKVKASGLKTLQDSGHKEIDLKIRVETDSSSLASIHRAINKIKQEYSIEYYQQEIKVNEVKVDVPDSLDQTALLKKYCETKKVPYALVELELR